MAIIPLSPGNFDYFEIVGRPFQKYSSGSHLQPTGSIALTRTTSKSIKDVQIRSEFGSGPLIDNTYLSILESAQPVNNFAQFTITVASGSYTTNSTPAYLKIAVGSGQYYNFYLKSYENQVIPVDNDTNRISPRDITIDISDLIQMTSAAFAAADGVKILAKRIQNTLNQKLPSTITAENSNAMTTYRHFVVSNLIDNGDNTFDMTVQHIKTPFYSGGLDVFIENLQVAPFSNIAIGEREINTSSNITTKASALMSETNKQPVSANQNKSLRIIRFEPSVRFTKDTMRKSVIKDVLYPSYRSLYPNLHWSYTNYHCMNFFTGSGIPDNSSIMYLNKLKPKYSVEFSVLKNNSFDSSKFEKNTDSDFVTPAGSFSVDGITSDNKVFVMDSTAVAGASYGRHLKLKTRIPSGSLCTVRFDALKATGGLLSSIGKISLDTTKTIDSFNGIKIELKATDGTTKTYVLDRFDTYVIAGNEIAVNIALETTINGILSELSSAIVVGHSNKIIMGTPTSSNVLLTQAVGGTAGDTTITIAGDNNQAVTAINFANGAASDLVETPSAAALNEPQPAVAATAEITIANVNIHNVELTLKDYDDKTIIYKFDTSVSNTGHKVDGKVIVGLSGVSGTTAYASKLQDAILSANGHNGSVRTSPAAAVLTLTQSTSGLLGNKDVTKANDGSNALTIPGTFTGGFTGEDIVILHSFDNVTWTEALRVDTTSIKTVNQNEWTKIEHEIGGDLIISDYYVKIAQSTPSADNNDHHILNNITFTLDKLDEDSNVKLPYPYSPREDFTMGFWIKPKIVEKDKNNGYKAGTVLHLTSSYAVSIVSGSSIDETGRSNKFRVMCQFNTSTDVAPSDIPLYKPERTDPRPDPDPWIAGSLFKNGEYPRDGRIITKAKLWEDDTDLIFLSSDNALTGDAWHHVAIRWSANHSHRTGSIFIDGNLDSTFYINSGSVMPRSMPGSKGDPSVLIVGNYYNGRNDGNEGALLSQFFNGNASYQEGLPLAYKSIENAIPNYQIDNFLYNDPNDILYEMDHPLKAEVHELKIYKSFNSHLSIKDTLSTQKKLPEKDLVFYLPVHFTPESPIRDIMQTPFQTVRSTTNDPFNVALSFGVGGKAINLTNFLKEHVQKTYPRLLNLTASAIIATDTKSRTANEWLGSIPSHRKGSYTILPCDNGLFRPNYYPLMTGSQTVKAVTGSINYVFRDDNNYSNLGLISLRNMVSTASLPMNPGHLLQNPTVALSSIESILEGSTPEDPGIAPGSILSILNRTRDPDSNEVAFFDISNMFYGNRIGPNTITIKDKNLSGSNGSVSITLKDDGYGNIYRHDCITKPAKWNNIGDIIYDEGIVSIKNPIFSHFGRTQFEIEFRGEQKVPVLEVTVPCPRNAFNSSSNPNFQTLKPTSDASETALDFVYITGLNLHDENLNIVGKATFAQPIIKRATDTFLVKVKMDF